MVKADLGTKRVCPSCGARFYDLSRKPISCPKCGAEFEPEALFKQRRSRQTEEDEKPEKEAGEMEAELENEEAPEAVEDDQELAATEDEEDPAAPHVDEHTAAGMSVVDAEDVTIEDIDDEAVEEDEADDALLEPDEGDEDDVSGIIDADIEKDER